METFDFLLLFAYIGTSPTFAATAGCMIVTGISAAVDSYDTNPTARTLVAAGLQFTGLVL